MFAAVPLANLVSHISFAVAVALLSLLLTWSMARWVRVMDVPGERSSHSLPTPTSGGLAIVISFVTGCLIIYFVADVARIRDQYFWSFLLGGSLLAIVSFVDDVSQKAFFFKIAAQMVCVGAVIGSGLTISELWIPAMGRTSLGAGAYIITFIWIVGLTNAYNFMDGLDGLVSGVGVIAAIFLCAIALLQGSFFVYAVSYALIASIAGFLVFNFPPAKIFMGDVGSAFIGFTFATLAVLGANLDQGHLPFYIVPMLLFHFIFDTGVTFFRRLAKGERVYRPHRTNLYQLLNRLGYSHKAVSLFYYGVTVAQGIGAYSITQLAPDARALAFVPFILFQTVYAWWTLSRAKAKGLI